MIRKIISSLAVFFMSCLSVLAQENQTDNEYQVDREYFLNLYMNAKPEFVWQDYVVNVTTHELSWAIIYLKDPYYSWAVKELLGRDIEPFACGLILKEPSYQKEIKDRVFKKCIARSYNMEDFWRLGLEEPSDYLQAFIFKVLENDLTNEDLVSLIRYSLPQYREEIFTRINISSLDSYNLDRLIPMFPDRGFLKSIYEDISRQAIREGIKADVLMGIMKKESQKTSSQ